MTRSVGLLLLVQAMLVGCDGSSSSEYRPVSEHAAPAQRAQTSATGISAIVTPETTLSALPEPTLPSAGLPATTNTASLAQVTTKAVPSTTQPTEPITPAESPAASGNQASTSDSQTNPNELEWPVSALAPLNVVDGTRLVEVMSVGNPGGAAIPAVTIEAAPREVSILVPQRTFVREKPDQALRVTFDDLDLLKVINMEPVTLDAVQQMPAWLRELNGQRIRLRGFMIPTYEATGLTSFVLARDTQLCCFGRSPKIYDVIQVELRPGRECNYLHLRPFDVVGTLKIDLVSDEGELLGLYWIEDAFVIEK